MQRRRLRGISAIITLYMFAEEIKLKFEKIDLGFAGPLHPHLDRDTRPEFIALRVTRWIPPGRTLFIASNGRTPGFFGPLAARYRVAYSSNYSSILDPVIENNYQLFMVERLILACAKTFVRTFKEDDTDLSLTDDPIKKPRVGKFPCTHWMVEDMYGGKIP